MKQIIDHANKQKDTEALICLELEECVFFHSAQINQQILKFNILKFQCHFIRK